jgi:hypothetical protein
MAIVNGKPAISYRGGGPNTLRYVRSLDFDGSEWGNPLSLDSDADSTLHTSLAVVGGRPAVAYFSRLA